MKNIVQNKETAVSDYMEMIEKSWTWARLTEIERKAFQDSVSWSVEQGIIVGSWKHRWMILQALYTMLLNTIGYEPFGWREKEV